MNHLFRALPSVDACLAALADDTRSAGLPRPLLRDAVTAFLDQRRQDIRSGHAVRAEDLRLPALLPSLRVHARRAGMPRLRRVLNATGVVIHTNMGRSVLARAAVEAVHLAASGYCNLELDMSTGGRGSRHSLTEDLLRRITGAEAALVVNNNAAAVILVLESLCKGGEVVVSRGQLVEIGGSFRIPEIMEKSGVRLREVGTTNRTRLSDYEAALNESTVALLRVHPSNYRIVGFHEETSLEELAALARTRDLPVIEDLGSGSLMDFTPYGLPGEPTVQAVLRAGAHVATFSGDKVLGGPQAGVIVGRAYLLERIRRNPLLRALRPDKLTLAALEATLRLCLEPEKALREIPTARMMTAAPEDLARRARVLRRSLRRRLGEAARCELRKDCSRVGGGSFPERDLPTTLVCLKPAACTADALKERLLTGEPPLLGRIEDDAFCLDVRTLSNEELPLAVAALEHALADAGTSAIHHQPSQATP